jgi:hypothetical protein
VDALFVWVEEGTLDMDAEHTRNPSFDRGVDGGDGPGDDIEIVADQRGQEAGGAELAVGAADRGDAFDGWLVVEQHAAAAIHLEIDEAGEEVSLEFEMLNMGGAFCRGTDGSDPAALDEHVAVRFETVWRQDAAGKDGKGAHRVSVTFLRCGGSSGWKPRAMLRAVAIL